MQTKVLTLLLGLLAAIIGPELLADTPPGLAAYTAGPYQVTAGFIPDKPEITVGEPLWVTEHIQNTGKTPFETTRIGELQGFNLNITVKDPAGKGITKMPTMWVIDQLSGEDEMQPGDQLREHALATEYSVITTPGIYTVTCERNISLAPANSQKSITVMQFAPHGANSTSLVDIVSRFSVQVDPADPAKIGQIIDEFGKNALSTSEDSYRYARSLIQFQDPRVVPWLGKIIASHNFYSFDTAVYALENYPTVEGVRALLPALGAPNETPCGAPHNALAVMESKAGPSKAALVIAVRTPLLKEVRSTNAATRASACAALGDTGDPVVLKSLINATRDPNEKVRCASAFAIGCLGDQDGRRTLKHGLKSSDPAYRDSCSQGIKQLDWYISTAKIKFWQPPKPSAVPAKHS
jgi:hypothetical protein